MISVIMVVGICFIGVRVSNERVVQVIISVALSKIVSNYCKGNVKILA